LHVRVLGFRHQRCGANEADEDDRDVDEEDRSPPKPGEQEAAGDRADGDPEPDGPGPGADGAGTLAGVAEDIDSDAGMVRAAPLPITARQAIRGWTEPEKAAPTDPTAKTERPMRKNLLRPKRSARLPPTNSRPANTIA
jgi:hypothetical protein